jgi:hypothetical protein
MLSSADCCQRKSSALVAELTASALRPDIRARRDGSTRDNHVVGARPVRTAKQSKNQVFHVTSAATLWIEKKNIADDRDPVVLAQTLM